MVYGEVADCNTRPNLQHYNFKQTQGFLIHLNAIPRTEDPRIANIGTGTGIWLLDVANGLSSSVRLDGFDISLSQAPPKEWLPRNVSMRELDIFEDLPNELVGQYGSYRIRPGAYSHQRGACS